VVLPGPREVCHDDRLRKMKAAGCWFLELGIESGSDRLLRLIKKGASKEDIAGAVARARAVGLKVKGNFIFGCQARPTTVSRRRSSLR